MSSGRYLFTSESVSMGHPDKVADQVSDAILDFCLKHDPMSRVACETLVTTDHCTVAGEVTTNAPLTRYAVDQIVRDTIRDKKMVALGRIVLTRREHVIMLEAFDKGLLAVTLKYPYEVRDHAAYFEDVPDLKLPAEMKDLASHIVDSKATHFDPSAFEDHYETALVDMLRAKQAGTMIEPKKAEAAPQRVINLMDALRASIGAETKKKPAAASTKARAPAAAKRKTAR